MSDLTPEQQAEIEAKWDELLSTPESHSFLDKLSAQAKADQEAGRLIPGGFGKAEFTSELELALKTLIGKVQEGLVVCEQSKIAEYIYEAIASIELGRDDETEHTPHVSSTEEDTRGQGRTEKTKDIP